MNEKNNLHEITVPQFIIPQQTIGQCCYMGDPLDLSERKVAITWLFEEGDCVNRCETVCEGIADLHILGFESPVSGTLIEILRHDDEFVSAGDVIGIVEQLQFTTG